MGKGQTFLSDKERTPKGDEKRHLFIVIAENNLEYLVVPIDRLKKDGSWEDTRCLLNKGDHSFIRQKSWVNFKRARTISSIELFNGLQKGIFIRKEDLRPELIDYICACAKESDFLPMEFLSFFQY